MVSISRNPASTAEENFDVIIVGGGIYGAMLSLEASKNGLRTLLLERDDFGAATSFNSLRILHGGLRYLQKLDMLRFHESVGERRWFLQHYPELTGVLPCLMPLYGSGMHRPSILRVALSLNDILSWYRNKSVQKNRRLLSGTVLSPEDTKRIFPHVDVSSLRGGAIWYDACIPDSQRIVMEVLRWASAMGAKAINYIKVNSLEQQLGQVIGVSARDKFSGETLQFNSPVVVNATGPWSRIIADSFDQDVESLFSASVAWNILLDRPTLSDHALAVAPKRSGAQMYFIHPWKGKILAGTGHKPWSGGPDNPEPTQHQVNDFLQDINDAIPGLNLENKDIIRVFAGLLPAQDQSGAGLATREVILDHEDIGGPSGLFSISGVKFTTSRLVAEKTIKFVLNKHSKRFKTAPALVSVPRPAIQTGWDMSAAAILQHESDTDWKQILTRIKNQESVMHLDDLVLRRTTLWEDVKCMEIAPVLCSLFNWDDARQIQELNRLNLKLKTKVAA